MRRASTMILNCVLAMTASGVARAQTSRPVLAPPVVDGRWLQPAATDAPATPEWGNADGLRVGIAPLPGPRGLLRIYTPYLGQHEPTMLNFIAIEPTPIDANGRGLSELEHSALDDRPGKRFWSTATGNEPTPQPANRPVRGSIETINGVEQLTVFIQCERFNNGAHVYVRLRFRADRPHEVGIAVFAHPDSKPLRECVVTATMGNYARLRELHLKDRVITSKQIWPTHTGDAFTPHARFALDALKRNEAGDAYVWATPDEADPENATYTDDTTRHWHYAGQLARQWWRMPSPPADLHAQVNGRAMYWASRSPIPGGVAFENFELTAPFEQGQEFWFGAGPINRDDDHAGATTRPLTQQSKQQTEPANPQMPAPTTQEKTQEIR